MNTMLIEKANINNELAKSYQISTENDCYIACSDNKLLSLIEIKNNKHIEQIVINEDINSAQKLLDYIKTQYKSLEMMVNKDDKDIIDLLKSRAFIEDKIVADTNITKYSWVQKIKPKKYNIKNMGMNIDKNEYMEIVLSNSNHPEVR